MQQLHWMLYPPKINYKIVLLMFKCVNNIAPPYLSELVHFTETVTVTDSTDHATKTLREHYGGIAARQKMHPSA